MKKYKKIVSVIIIFAGLAVFQKASAVEYGMLGGRPANPDPNVENSSAWFIYNLPAGESKEDAITVMNLFDTPLDVLIYPADSTPSSSGGFALKQFAEGNTEVGSWVKFYPDDVPADFSKIFKDHESSIVALCKMSHEALQKEFGKKAIIDQQFSDLEKWCQGKDTVERQFQSKETVNISFVISVPQSADVGEHTGGILIQKKATDDQAGPQAGSTVKLTTRVGVRIYETVPGDIIKKLSLDNFQVIKNFKEFSFTDWFGEKKPKEYLVQSNISNSGNVSVEHENNILIKNLLSGKEPQVIERKFQALKGDKFIANMAWQKPLLGYYSFQAQIKYQGTNGDETLLSAPIKIWIIPWREITLVLILAAILAGIYAGWRRYYKKKYGGIGWVEYKVGKADTVAKLSEKYKVDWKVLVKTNKIKAPYYLKSGQDILVPAGKMSDKKNKTVDVVNIKKNTEQMDIKKASESNEPKVVKESKSSEKRKVTIVDVFYKKPKKTKKEKKSLPNIWVWALAGAVVLMAILSLIVILAKNKDNPSAPAEKKISLADVNSNVPEQKEQNTEQPEEKTAAAETAPVSPDISKINIKILNEGSPAGLAGKVKNFLVSQGYLNSIADNGSANVQGNFMVVNKDELKAGAEQLVTLLKGRNVKVVVRDAQSEEDKSADIVITLGK